MIKKYLTNWKLSIDSSIRNAELEIEKKRADNISYYEALSEIEALIKFIEANDLPADVERGLCRCLKWNPFATEGGLL